MSDSRSSSNSDVPRVPASGPGRSWREPSRGVQSVLERTSRAHLRTILSWITAVVVSVALVVSAALVFLTTYLSGTSESLAAAVESVRIAEETEIALLLHGRALDPVVRQDIAAELRGKLGDAEQFVTTPTERAVLGRAAELVDDYLQACEDPGVSEREQERRRGAAYAAVQALVDDNVSQAQDAQASARRWDTLANKIGITAAGLLLLVAGVVMWWLRTRAFRPLWEIARAMETFGRGDRDARASEVGPAELREVAQRFNQMASALAAQQRAQMTFLGGVAHDLRNPLCALRMAVSGVERDGPPPDVHTRQTLELVGRQTTVLERMVGDFLDIARIEAGELQLELAKVDLRELVEGVAEIFRGWSALHPVALSLPDAPVPVCCDALRIEQAIVNLLSNAIKYSPEGGEVAVTVAVEGGEAVVSVRDRGIGIRPGDRGKIFEPFTRVGLSRETIPGAGLGLYIVQKIVHAHDGRVEVDSAPGAGSTFRLRLPLSRV